MIEAHQAFQQECGDNCHGCGVKAIGKFRVVGPVERNFMPVCKNQIGRDTTVVSKHSHASDDQIRGGNFSESPAFNDKTPYKVKKTVGALNISRRA